MELAPFRETLSALRSALSLHSQAILAENSVHFGRTSKLVIFLSASDGKHRAVCACGVGNSLNTAWKAAASRLGKLMPDESQWVWIKADMAHSIRPMRPDEVMRNVATTRRNFFRQGIAFDPNFNLALLEQELNGIGGIGFDDTKNLVFRFDRINRYLKSSRGLKSLSQDIVHREMWYVFEALGYFCDRSELGGLPCELISTGYGKGIRVRPNAIDDAGSLIERAGLYLARQLRSDGAFHYGVFPVRDEAIPTYNILRHSSTLYSMLEAAEATGNAQIADRVPGGIEYVIREAMRHIGDQSLIVDYANKGEVRLGAQATFILAVAKYTALSGDQRFIGVARRVAAAIVERFLDAGTGAFVHVLDGIDLRVKDRFRIIYYDGEAVLALLRLHEIDGDSLWLEKAKQAFDHFVRVDHWKHHDHWLAYCANEITRKFPHPAYYLFGLKNGFGNLEFIHQRDTAYPTFLELLMATWEMVIRVDQSGQLPEQFSRSRLLHTIRHRLEHLRYSHFYPEVAMYFKSPATIAGSFFIRHHGFRIRIDDVEHFISGYCLFHALALHEVVER